MKYPTRYLSLFLLSSAFVFSSHSRELPAGQVIGNRVGNLGDNPGDLQNALRDRENAMDWATSAAATRSLEVIYSRLPSLSAAEVNNAFDSVKSFINQPINRTKTRPLDTGCDYYPTGVSNLKYINALHALENNDPVFEANYQAYQSITENYLFETITLNSQDINVHSKDLLARVWRLIETHQNPVNMDEKGQMKDNLLTNLNYCIKESGKRVCGIGTIKRLLQSIEGFVEGVNISVNLPTPQAFVNSYRHDIDQRLQSASNDLLSDFLYITFTWESTPETFYIRLNQERLLAYQAIASVYGYGPQAQAVRAAMDEQIFADWYRRVNTQNSYAHFIAANPITLTPPTASTSARPSTAAPTMPTISRRRTATAPAAHFAPPLRKLPTHLVEELNRDLENLRRDIGYLPATQLNPLLEETRAEFCRHNEILVPSYFDHNHYLTQVPTLEATLVNQLDHLRRESAINHYVNIGRIQNLTITKTPIYIDVEHYLSRAPLLAASVLSQSEEVRYQAVINHYIAAGQREKRTIAPDLDTFDGIFDHNFYLQGKALNNELRGLSEAVRRERAIYHYLHEGRDENNPVCVIPSDFDAHYYLERAPRLNELLRDFSTLQRKEGAYNHYVKYGRNEGRRTHA